MTNEREGDVLLILRNIVGNPGGSPHLIEEFPDSTPKHRGRETILSIKIVQESNFFVEQNPVGADTVASVE